MRGLLYFIATAFIAAGLTASVHAEEEEAGFAVLTLADAEQLALRSDEGLIALHERTEAENALVEAADRWPDPMLSLEALNYPGFGESDWNDPMQQNMLSLSQSFPQGHTLDLQRQQAAASGQQAQAMQASGKGILLRRVRQVWLEVFLLERKQALLSQQVDSYRDQLQVLTAALRVSSQSQRELIMLEAELSGAEAELATARADLAAARIQIRRWLGGKASRPWPDVLPSILIEKPPVRVELTTHPELVALEAGWQKANYEAKVAREGYKPRWSVGVSYAEREIFDNMVNLGVSVEIPFFNSGNQDHTVRAREAEASAARHEWLDNSLLMQSRYEGLRLQLDGQSERLEQYEKKIVPGLQAGIELAQASYRSGRGSYRDWLEAYDAYIEAALKELDIRRDYTQLLIEILYLNEEVSL